MLTESYRAHFKVIETAGLAEVGQEYRSFLLKSRDGGMEVPAVAYRPSCGIPAVTFPFLRQMTMSNSSMGFIGDGPLISPNQHCKWLIK